MPLQERTGTPIPNAKTGVGGLDESPVSCPVSAALTQVSVKRLAELCEVTRNYMSLIVHGRKTPSYDVLIAMSRSLNVSLDNLSQYIDRMRTPRKDGVVA